MDIVDASITVLSFFLFRTSASLKRQFMPEAMMHYPEVPLNEAFFFFFRGLTSVGFWISMPTSPSLTSPRSYPHRLLSLRLPP